ncbi:MAG: ATP-binding protein [Thaumarchaeota archaeon]|nr:ATP-binding protein [Nitrososphaerota archaeon]
MISGYKGMFIVALSLAVISSLAAVASREGITFEGRTLTLLGLGIALVVTGAVLVKSRGWLNYKINKHEKPIESENELAKLLGIKSITPKGNHILTVSEKNTKVGHAYVRITEVPYVIDDLDKDRKFYFVQNFVRLLSNLNFTFEIIPRMSPIPKEWYLKDISSKISDLRLTLEAEGNVADPSRQARLKRLEKLAQRLLEGEGARDVGFLLHVMAEGKDESEIAREIDSNVKTLMSTLQSGLGIDAKRLQNHEMLKAVREFFPACGMTKVSKPSRMLTWDLAYLVPLTKPKLPPVSKLLEGAYLGRTSGDAPVFIGLSKYINPHVTVLGETGGGKSTTVKSLLSREHDLHETNILIIDFAGEYKDWVISRGGKVIDAQNVTIDPFDLGPLSLANKIQQLTDAFAGACDFNTTNQKRMFAQYVARAYEKKGYRKDDPTTWKNPTPTLAEVVKLIESDVYKATEQRQNILTSIVDKLVPLAEGTFGIFGKSKISYQDLMNGFVCVDLSGIASEQVQNLVAYVVLQYVDSTMRIAGERKQIKLILVLDEAWKLCKHEDSIPVKIIKEGRKYGYSLFVSSQDLGDTAEPILSNAGTAVIHRTDNPRYTEFFRHKYGLTESEVMRLKNLPVGEALLKLSIDPRPFFVRVEMETVESTSCGTTVDVSLVEEPSFTVQVQNNMKSDYSDQSVPTQAPIGKFENILTQPNPDNTPVPSRQTHIQSPILSLTATKLLKNAASDPTLKVTEHYAKLGLSPSQGDKAKQELEKLQLIEAKEMPRVEGEGRWGKILALTDKGRRFLGTSKSRRFGGNLHENLLAVIAKRFREEGHAVDIEFPLGEGKLTDMVVDEKVAIELETRDFNIENITKNLKHGFEKVIILCLSKGQSEKFRKKLGEHNISDSRILVTEVSSYLHWEVEADD